MTTPTDAIAGLRKWNDGWPHWKFTEHQHNALRLVLDHSEGAATAIDALQERVKELDAQRDAALERVEELEQNAGVVSDEFEKDCWKAMRSLLSKCKFDWRDVEPDGVTADDACAYIHDTISDLESRALRAEQERDEAVALLVRVNALAQTQAWRRMPDGATFSTTPLAGDINTTIRRLAGSEKEGK